jgi:hypothetical protein
MIQATVAVYPLGQADYTAVHRSIDALRGQRSRSTCSRCTPRSPVTKTPSLMC